MGAATEKALSPQVRFFCFVGEFQEVGISRPEGAGGNMAFDKVREVTGSLVV